MDIGGQGQLSLSATARALLERFLSDGFPREWEPGMDELAAIHVAFQDPLSQRFILADSRRAEELFREAEHAKIAASLGRIQSMAALVDALTDSRPKTDSGGGIEVLPHRGLVTPAITEAVRAATVSVYTAQPSERPPDVLARSLERDIGTLKRGVAMRAIYLANARDRQEHIDYVNEIAKHGGEVRTSLYPFERMVLVDKTVAFVTDYFGDANVAPALKVTNPNLVELFARFYQQQWETADPWAGEIRPASGGITTRRSRRILRLVWEGVPLKAIASDLRVSLSTVHGDLKRLHEATGTQSLMALGEWWASPAASRERDLAAQEQAARDRG